MSETSSHKTTKGRAARRGGQTEVPISHNRRLDALSASGRVTEVERSGAQSKLEQAARRLHASGASQRVLQVPQPDMPKAVQAMKSEKVTGTVKNFSGTKSKRV
jgi:hypothetical protein